MQDGQNLFGTEPKRKDVDWQVDETCDELTRRGEIDPPSCPCRPWRGAGQRPPGSRTGRDVRQRVVGQMQVCYNSVKNLSAVLAGPPRQWHCGARAMFKSKRLTFDELSERLHAYEQKYGYSTIEFYRRFQGGTLGDDDDLMMWAGLYHLYLTSLPVRQFMQQEPAPV
jgi:hypothetical protein